MLLHLSSVPCFKFVMRGKVIFTPGCVQDLFKAFIQGSLSMQLLRLSAARESKGNTVDAVIARRCPQKELSLNWTSLSPSVGEKQTYFFFFFFYVKSEDHLNEWRPMTQYCGSIVIVLYFW